MENRKRVLVVDDERPVLNLLSAMLTARGFDVDTVETGKGAVERVAISAPDVVLMDINLPDMDGLMAAFHLHAAPETRGVPIVLMSGDLPDDVMVEARRLGCVEFLHKPFAMKDLLEVVQKSIRQNQVV